MDGVTNAQEFDVEHGGDAILINGWLYFPDGAYRETHPLGARVVPNDPCKKAKFVVAYWQAKVNLAANEFAQFKRNLLARTKACRNRRICDPPPGRDAIERLKAIKEKALNYEIKLAEAQENMENCKPEEMTRREEANDETRQQCEDVFSEIQSIEI